MFDEYFNYRERPTEDMIEIEKQNFLQKLRAYIVLAGGRMFEEKELGELSFKEILSILYSNDLRLAIDSIR